MSGDLPRPWELSFWMSAGKMVLVSTTNGHVADSFSIQRESGFLYILFRHGGQLNYRSISHAIEFPAGSAVAWQCWDA